MFFTDSPIVHGRPETVQEIPASLLPQAFLLSLSRSQNCGTSQKQSPQGQICPLCWYKFFLSEAQMAL